MISKYLYVTQNLNRAESFTEDRLDSFTERHKISLPCRGRREISDPFAMLAAEQFRGMVIELNQGLPPQQCLELAGRVVASGRRLFFYWPQEEAMECVDQEKIASFQSHLVFAGLYHKAARIRRAVNRRLPAALLRGVPLTSLVRTFLGAPADTRRQMLARKVETVNLLASAWTCCEARAVESGAEGLRLVTDDSAGLYQATAQPLAVSVGALLEVRLEGVVNEGAVAIGLLSDQGDRWLVSWHLPEGRFERVEVVDLAGNLKPVFVVTTADAGRSSSVTLQKLEASAYPLLLRSRLLKQNRPGNSQFSVETSSDPQCPSMSTTLYGICREDLDRFASDTSPILFRTKDGYPSEVRTTGLKGVYLRTDYWARISSGGSYGHTCYVARALRHMTGDLTCFMAHRYELLDSLGIKQVVIDAPSATCNEEDIVMASDYYYRQLRGAVAETRPDYIYERICLGNYAGARLSRELGIPYIVEYNGSEISMKRSFDGTGYAYEEFYKEAELAAFSQATVISVISEAVKEDVIGRGVDPYKILLNPNGADIEAYTPLMPGQKMSLKNEFGWDDSHVVIGFTGTFGGWHGIDILAEALPRICAEVPEARWMIIGDGNFKHLVDQAVRDNKLSDRVYMAGRVPQHEGARLLGACDIYVSPHNSHMVDSRFFGSPTKIFEYMSMGGGIVASDLEQIGEVLSPALRVGDLEGRDKLISDHRAVLCTPGDAEEFVSAVALLARRPEVTAAIGANARRAVEEHYSWDRHVTRLWEFIAAATRQAEKTHV